MEILGSERTDHYSYISSSNLKQNINSKKCAYRVALYTIVRFSALIFWQAHANSRKGDGQAAENELCLLRCMSLPMQNCSRMWSYQSCQKLRTRTINLIKEKKEHKSKCKFWKMSLLLLSSFDSLTYLHTLALKVGTQLQFFSSTMPRFVQNSWCCSYIS